MENRSKEIAKVLEKYAKEISTNWPFYTKGNIPSKCVDNAMNTYAKGIDRTALVGLYDITLLNNGKAGYLFTDKGIYYKETLSPCEKLLYSNIVSVRLGPQVSKEENRSIYFKLIDGTEEVWTTTYIKKAPLKEFMDELLLFLKEDRNETNKDEEVESNNEDSELINKLNYLSNKFDIDDTY